MKHSRLFLVFTFFFIFLFSTHLVQADVFIKGYFGALYGTETEPVLGYEDSYTDGWGDIHSISFWGSVSGQVSTTFLKGLKLGIWLDRSSLLNVDFPDWMKFVGLYVDLGFHRLDYPLQIGSYSHDSEYLDSRCNIDGKLTFGSRGSATQLGILFAFRKGFFPDSESPQGRLQAFVGLGPGFLFCRQEPTVRIDNMWSLNGQEFTAPVVVLLDFNDLGEQKDTVLGIVLEAGAEWKLQKNLSFETSLKYLFAKPSFAYEYSGKSPAEDPRHLLLFEPAMNLICARVGLGIHF